MLLNQPQSELGQTCTNSECKIDRQAKPSAFIAKIKDVKKNSNYQLLAVVLLSDKAKVLEPSPPYPGLRAPKRTQSLQG